MTTPAALNSPETYMSTLSFIFTSVWQFFTNTRVPFFNISFAQFWIALFVIGLVLLAFKMIIGFDLFDTSVSSKGSGSNSYKIPSNRKGD